MSHTHPHTQNSADDAHRLTFPEGTEPELRAVPNCSGQAPLVLVLGASGYVGGRLVPRLLAAGYRVRVLVRSRERAESQPWARAVDIRVGDASDHEAVSDAVSLVDTVYFLVHSMAAGAQFAQTDLAIARTVAASAAGAGVQRIIYLGGLHPEGVKLSPHLASRTEVAETLLEAPVPTVVLQAGVIIGSGSASFEMVRHLTEVLPYMPAPRWVRNFIQPIAIRDVLYYLLAAARSERGLNRALDIGGPDALRYGQMMNGYAVEAGLPQRRIAALPVLTPKLASHWVGLVTPVPRRMARPLVESLQHDCVVRNPDVDHWIPEPNGGLTPYRQSLRLALGRLELDAVETSWLDARVPRAPSDPLPSDPEWAGRTVFTDERVLESSASPEALWAVISQIGGRSGWYSAPALWSLRGFIDQLMGGVGLKRGRRTLRSVAVGDAIDVWRVETVRPLELLTLRAEMRLPGEAWLEFAVQRSDRGSQYQHRAIFIPRGLRGRLYWLSMLPFHGLIFSSMSRRIVSRAESRNDAS